VSELPSDRRERGVARTPLVAAKDGSNTDTGAGAAAPVILGPDLRRRPHGAQATLIRGLGTVTINHGGTFLVASPDGSISSDGGGEQGLYADDTRFLSHHHLQLNGRPLESIAASRLSFRHARWTMVAHQLGSVAGDVEDARVTVVLDRIISDRRLHEDLLVRSYAREPVSLLLSLDLAADFADLFEVRTRRWQRRSTLTMIWQAPAQLDTRYVREDFVRRCLLRATSHDPDVTYANGALRFPIDLRPGGEWRLCLQYDLTTALGTRPRVTACPLVSPVVDRAERLRRRWHRTVARAHPADLRLLQAFDQAVEDFAALRLYDHDFSLDVWLPAAGVPWFVAVFGRDSIIASLQAMPVHPLFAIGTLQKLAQWQSDVDDPERDAEPGKICHEMRVGEWAHFRTIPHTPYYGTADATPLYLLLLAETYRWMGDPELLHRFRATAVRCLEWIDGHGDRDGDGFQEYAPRTAAGYRNHCWRDAEDGVLDEHGAFPPHPIGTCEMQGYVYAAKLAIADLFAAWDDRDLADRLRAEAGVLRRRFHEAYWDPERGELAFALDGDKRRVMTATSNPGHCLWSGIVDPALAGAVADRLMRADLFSGWGLRTLSTHHPAYDPHSYQRGSVWPHDTMLAAAGLRRYGRTEDAWALIEGLLSAASAFERAQLPELFAGLPRMPPDVPVPYERANVPQAWAAGAVFHAVRVLLGLEPDVPGGRVYIDPALPPWCPQLQLDNVRVGTWRLSVAAWRRADGSSEAHVEVEGGRLAVLPGRPPWSDVSYR
jgi:glycogen debranching enzyme